MNINDRRETCIELLCDNALTGNLILCSKIDPANQSDDIVEIEAFISTYIVKHKVDFIKFDSSSSSIEKSFIVGRIGTYLRSLNPDQLEGLGALLCKLFDYDDIYVTKKTHDQGIDILAVKSFKFFDTNRKSYIIGQSKNYADGLVDVKEVRELAGAILLLRHQEFSQNLIAYPAIKITSFSSITAIFVTSYYFSESAAKLCDQSGILPFDFADLVCILSKAALENKIDVLTANAFDAKKMSDILSAIPRIN